MPELHHITVEGRPFTVHGSAHWKTPTHHSDLTFIVDTAPLPQDPDKDHGGYVKSIDPYPAAFIGHIQAVPGAFGCEEGYGIVPPYTEGFYVVDYYSLGSYECMQRGVLGFATTAEEAWQVAAQSLAKAIAERFAA